jgi:hypothetical protein
MDAVQEIIRDEKIEKISETLEQMMLDAMLATLLKIRDENSMDEIIEQEMRDQGSGRL